MKVIIYVFTGTANTLKVAKLYAKYFACDTTIYQIKEPNNDIPDPKDYDLVGLGYPVHAYNAPEPFVNFIKKLPNVENKQSFIFKTSGEGLRLNHISSLQSIKILNKKGYQVIQEGHIVMPYNIIFRHTDGMAKQMWIYAKALADLYVREIKAGKKENFRGPFYKRIIAAILRIEWWWAKFHGPWFKVDKKKCIDCGKCMRDCPMQNITKEKGEYKFHHQCALCMGCSFHCPTDAIHIGIFKFWKVHGDYNVDKLEKDESIKFPYLDGTEKGIYKIYRKYYRQCDEQLKKAHININDYKLTSQ